MMVVSAVHQCVCVCLDGFVAVDCPHRKHLLNVTLFCGAKDHTEQVTPP